MKMKKEKAVKKESKTPSICLVMIVKNESAVIRRCLDSVAKFIDYWVIVDTGSTDGTQDIIQSHMAELGIPGKLYEREWKDFGTNRTESLQLAAGKCDYRMVIDADDVLEVEDEKAFDNLSKDSYRIPIQLADITYNRIQIVRSSQKWKYVGVLHEYIAYDEEPGVPSEGEIFGVKMIAGVSGDKRDLKGKEKYYNDALIFEKEILGNKSLEPGLAMRYIFYCAQSYRDAGIYDRAIKMYERRIEMGGWPEEIYVSKYNVAKLKGQMGSPIDEVKSALLSAWEYRPVRLEAAYELMKILIMEKRYFLAFCLGNICMRMGACNDILFVEHDVWKWKFVDDYAVACFHSGNLEEAVRCGNSLLKSSVFPGIPDIDKERITKNVESFESAWKEVNSQKPLAQEDQPVQPPMEEVENLPKLGDI